MIVFFKTITRSLLLTQYYAARSGAVGRCHHAQALAALASPGEPWRPWRALAALASPGEPWRALASPGEPWRALASPGGHIARRSVLQNLLNIYLSRY